MRIVPIGLVILGCVTPTTSREPAVAFPAKSGSCSDSKYYFRVQRYRDAPAQWTVDLPRPPGWKVSCAFADR